MKTLLALIMLMPSLSACGESKRSPVDTNVRQTSLNGPRAIGSVDFQPLQSAAVKDAMRRALRSGETQRWEDGGFSGYAVPGPTGANGCRGIRYTVDQKPDIPFESITACEAR